MVDGINRIMLKSLLKEKKPWALEMIRRCYNV
jgi:hypothetical protein